MKHLEQHNETYIEHMIQAGGFGIRFFVISIILFIHAIIPCLFSSTATKMAIEIADDMGERIKKGSR